MCAYNGVVHVADLDPSIAPGLRQAARQPSSHRLGLSARAKQHRLQTAPGLDEPRPVGVRHFYQLFHDHLGLRST
jgi:hypothetical protein